MAELVWEEVVCVFPSNGFAGRHVMRAKVSGGWLVWAYADDSGLTFYPDPDHEWE